MFQLAMLAILLFATGAAGQPPRTLGSTPVPTPAEQAEFNRFVEGVIDPGNTLDLIACRPRLILLKSHPTRTQIADPSVASFRLLPPPGVQMTVMGLQPGITVLNLWFPDPAAPGRNRVLSYLVRVLPDPEAKARAAAAMKALEAELHRAFPDSRVRLGLVGDKVTISGQPHDVAEATKILRVLQPGGR